MTRIRIWEPADIRRRPGESDAEWRLRLLLRDLQTWAADAEAMVAAYDIYTPPADDLANDYDIHLEWALEAVREGLVTRAMWEHARAIDTKLAELSDRHDPPLWTNEALRTRPEWAEVRQLAREALEAMGYDLEPPPPLSM